MSSKILYDTRNNKILKCQRKPFGSAGMPSFKAVCRSAKVMEDEKQYMDTCVIKERMSTKEAKEKFIIKEGEAVNKPKLDINLNKNNLYISNDDKLKIKININVEKQNYNNVRFKINDYEFTINIEDTEEEIIKIKDTGKYTLECVDKRFISNSKEVFVYE